MAASDIGNEREMHTYVIKLLFPIVIRQPGEYAIRRGNDRRPPHPRHSSDVRESHVRISDGKIRMRIS